MSRIVIKLILFAMVVILVATINSYITNGPLLALHAAQVKDQVRGAPLVGPDMFNIVYLFEVLGLAYFGALLFINEFPSQLPSNEDEKEEAKNEQ